MSRTVDTLPQYLRKYCVEQTGDKYTPRDHAAWRYIMRQSRAYFKDHAVPIYLEGLKRTGITLDRIPLISEMDEKLQQLGWGAVPVCGFIPPAAFLDFQARKILPIAFDMRSVEHLHYTPAPDIVHEAAGHAPIIADRDYADYLTMYATMAQKAIFSQEDLDLYEAIRTLSDVKENPDSTRAMIDAAEAALSRASANVQFISEANKVARMNWWTVEYGLLGSLDNPSIYGAGLLSSVSESQNCLSPSVKKIRLTTDCVNTSYDITEPQPQLFVAEDIAHLKQVLKEFESELSFVRGGVYGLEQAQRGRTVTTTVLDSGLQISGRLDTFERAGNVVEFVRFTGPVQLAAGGHELPGQSAAHHPQGFSSPLGRALGRPDRPFASLTDAELDLLGLSAGKRAKLLLTSGFTIEGKVVDLLRHGKALISIKWRDCTVTRQGKRYFEPDWGDFDMAVGETVVSVFGGPADRERYGSHDLGTATTSPSRQSPFTKVELAAFEKYDVVRKARNELKKTGSSPAAAARALTLVDDLARDFPDEWLLRLEAIEVAVLATSGPSATAATSDAERRLADHRTRLVDEATRNSKFSKDIQWLVRQGIALADTPD